MKVEIWSDVVCPWCYVGKRRFEAALAQFAHREQVEVVWRAFELDPSAPRSYEGEGTYAERLARKYGSSVSEAQTMIDRMTGVAAELGLHFDFAISRTGNTFDAHRLLHLARVHGVQNALKERLLKATFSEGEPIGSHDALIRLAAEAGLSVDEAREVLESGRYGDEVRADERRAQVAGISGVPFFVFDERYGVSGAQPPERLLQVLERVWAERAPRPLEPSAKAAPGCDGGACPL